MIDPKMLELSVYDGIPHLLAPVVTDPKKAIVALKWTVREMEEPLPQDVEDRRAQHRRLQRSACRGGRAKGESLTRTVQTGFDEETGEPIFEEQQFDPSAMPLIVVVVDEMADLMMVAGKDIEAAVQRLAQMARAAGIHLIMATQRPSVDVITGTIKANFPTRISFQVTSKIDSRTILGEQGAEQLLGQGDMLYMAGGGRITRVHGPFVSDEEVEEVVQHSSSAQGAPALHRRRHRRPTAERRGDGDVLASAATAATTPSTTRRSRSSPATARPRPATSSAALQIGYNRAAKLIERWRAKASSAHANHVGKREVLAAAGAVEPSEAGRGTSDSTSGNGGKRLNTEHFDSGGG